MSKINKRVRKIENLFNNFVSNIMDPDPDRNVKIDTWIRGVPSVRVSWENDDGIDRNITACMEEAEPDIVEFEINAWKDTYDSEGFNRRWMHDDTDVVDLKNENNYDEVDKALIESYREVSGVSAPDLKEEKRIQTDTNP